MLPSCRLIHLKTTKCKLIPLSLLLFLFPFSFQNLFIRIFIYFSQLYGYLLFNFRYFIDVEIQMQSKEFARKFNLYNPPKNVDFVMAWLLELIEREGRPLYVPFSLPFLLPLTFHSFLSSVSHIFIYFCLQLWSRDVY